MGGEGHHQVILAGQDIRRHNIIHPLHERTVVNGLTYGLGPAGYDVRVSSGLIIPAHYFLLAATVERFTMPTNVVGFVHDKSTWARRGIALQNTVIEPGWRGYLTLEITNHSDKSITINAHDPIAQIVFHLMTDYAEAPYSGKYQDQLPGPQPAILERDSKEQHPNWDE